jgi:putative SOS response-associated peptidase YedK
MIVRKRESRLVPYFQSRAAGLEPCGAFFLPDGGRPILRPMCGRYLLEPRTPQAVRQFFEVAGEAALEPRWNLAPTQEAWVLRARQDGARELARLRWGLVPSWSQDASAAARLINARSETASVKPSFRSAWKARRCVVPATGWYEWQALTGRKKPWRLSLADSAFTAFAGLWERWQPAGGAALESFTILTAPAVPALADVHDRMPVVLPHERIASWLAGGADASLPSAEHLGALAWERHQVSTRVNSPRHDDAACAEPLTDGA